MTHTSRPKLCSSGPRCQSLVVLAFATLLLCSCQSLSTPSPLNSGRTSLRQSADNASARRLSAKPPAPVARVNHELTLHGPSAETSTVIGGPPAEPSTEAPARRPEQSLEPEMAAEIVESPTHAIPSTAHVSPSLPVGLPPAAFGPPWTTLDDYTYPSPEEYVCNGGDRETGVVVNRDWTVHGLHPGDTVAHYDTIDGRTRIQPSNEVCLYAPRFAAVRKVYGLVVNEQHDRAAGVELQVTAEQSDDVGEPTTVVQPLQAGRKHSFRTAQQFRERAIGEGVDNAQRPGLAQDRFLPFEDLLIIRRGVFDNTEKARVAERLEAAIAWTSDQAPQVVIDNENAVQIIGTTQSRSIYTYELPPGKARLRVIKIASKQNARSGETVDFTIRFDNVGDQPIGNVTVIDRLHDRLELVPDTQSSTLPANFSTQDEEGSPRILRWEITDAMAVGDGGIIRFQARVR